MRSPDSSPTAVGALLALVCVALHVAALSAGYAYDDPVHLQFAASHAPWQYFTQRSVMLQQSYAHLTPWNALFFDLGLRLAGLDARWHHAHLLAVVWACAWATWMLLRRWLGGHAALYAALLFLAMPPTAVVASLLMTGHYAYGLLFSILALQCQVLALQRRRLAWSVAAAVCYGLACLCKELYVPLVLVLLALPLADRRWRLRAAAPLLAVALAYAGWRLYVLGGVGGYAALSVDGGPPRPALPDILQRFAQGVFVHVFGPGWAGALALVLAAVMVAGAVWRGRRAPALLVAAATLALLVPVVPTFAFDLPYGAGRLMLVIGWALALALAWFIRLNRRTAVFALALLPLLVVQQRGAFERTQGPERIASQQFDFVLRAAADEVLIPVGYAQHGYLRAMADAARRVLGRDGPHIVDDEDEMQALGPERGARAWSWREDSRRLERLGERYQAALVQQRAARLAAAGQPLHGTLALQVQGRHRVVQWQVQSSPGRVFMHVEGYARLELPPQGALAFGLEASTSTMADPARVRMLVLTPDGALIRSQPVLLALGRSSSFALQAEPPEDAGPRPPPGE